MASLLGKSLGRLSSSSARARYSLLSGARASLRLARSGVLNLNRWTAEEIFAQTLYEGYDNKAWVEGITQGMLPSWSVHSSDANFVLNSRKRCATEVVVVQFDS